MRMEQKSRGRRHKIHSEEQKHGKRDTDNCKIKRFELNIKRTNQANRAL